MINKGRIEKLNNIPDSGNGPVIYWMSRDQRARDNWALIYAAELAQQRSSALQVVFCLTPDFPGAQASQYMFMLEGLKETARELEKLNIGFTILFGDPSETLPRYASEAGTLVTDFDPLRIKRSWKVEILSRIAIPFFEVDAHNIVPCRVASTKAEYGAYTIRPKIQRNLVEFLTDFPPLKPLPVKPEYSDISWKQLQDKIIKTCGNKAAATIPPGSAQALKRLEFCISEILPRYHEESNDPNADAVSALSAYLHFGQISPQRAALEIKRSDLHEGAKEAFLEQLIIRRELSDNYCFYNTAYDSTESFPDWAKQTLKDHISDPREYLYSYEEFEYAKTHDLLWNAAQTQMTSTGYMHGYMRMYWCKKIVEWTSSPEEAMDTAIRLNDCYQLDGRDPNGYAGIAWSVGGVHDRAWQERPVFGKIRYMNANGAKRKFNTAEYIEKWLGA